jgi:hypothetical protein
MMVRIPAGVPRRCSADRWLSQPDSRRLTVGNQSDFF